MRLLRDSLPGVVRAALKIIIFYLVNVRHVVPVEKAEFFQRLLAGPALGTTLVRALAGFKIPHNQIL